MCLAGTQHHKEGPLTQSGPLLGDQRGENRRSRKSRRATVGLAGGWGVWGGVLVDRCQTVTLTLLNSVSCQHISQRTCPISTAAAVFQETRDHSDQFGRKHPKTLFCVLQIPNTRLRLVRHSHSFATKCGDDNDVFGIMSHYCVGWFSHTAGSGWGGGKGLCFLHP